MQEIFLRFTFRQPLLSENGLPFISDLLAWSLSSPHGPSQHKFADELNTIIRGAQLGGRLSLTFSKIIVLMVLRQAFAK
jgi:hypothetical protein